MKTFAELTDELMPDSGHADTLEGEILRAINKIAYRLFNDGDLPTEGYGVETSGPALMFLFDNLPYSLKSIAQEIEDASYSGEYELNNVLKKAMDKITEYINTQMENDNLQPNTVDMLDYSSDAEDAYSCDDDYYDNFFEDDNYDDDDEYWEI